MVIEVGQRRAAGNRAELSAVPSLVTFATVSMFEHWTRTTPSTRGPGLQDADSLRSNTIPPPGTTPESPQSRDGTRRIRFSQKQFCEVTTAFVSMLAFSSNVIGTESQNQLPHVLITWMCRCAP